MGRHTFAVYARRDIGVLLPLDLRVIKKSDMPSVGVGQDNKFIGCLEANSYEDAIKKIMDNLAQSLGGKE